MSSTSLYGNVGNVTVAANNLVTLYNATPGNTTIANVPDRNFTTLYSGKQSDIGPTRPYGNSNVEAFLNVGNDGANVVQNINMSGTLTVGTASYLGNVGNVHIDGGNSGYVLTTNGLGELIWTDPGANGQTVEYIHFDVTSNGNNQQFNNANLGYYANSNVMAVFKNGVNIEPNQYQKISANVLQIDIPLSSGDDIDVLPSSSGGGGGTPGGYPNTIQYNTGYDFAGSNSFTFDSVTETVNISNLFVTTHANLGNVGNVYIGGGNTGYVLTTDGAGNLIWAGATASSNYAIYANYANFAGNAFSVTGSNVVGDVANANYANYSGTSFSVSGSNVTGQVAYANIANSVSGSNVVGYVNDSIHANVANVANTVAGANVTGTVANATYAVVAGSTTLANYVIENAQSNITSLGTLTGLTSTGIVDFTNTSNTSLGVVGNVHITGGTSGYVLSTDGSGNLSWVAQTGGGGGNSFIANGTSNVSINTANGNITFSVNGVANLMTVTSSGLTIASTTTIQQGIEKVTANSTGSTGTVNFDLLTQAILNKTGNATASFNINLRGNSTVTLDTVMSSNQSMTCTYVNKKNTGSPYVLSALQIDGTTQTVYWGGGTNPTTNAYLYDIYTFNVLKTASNTYTVFGTFGSYN